MGIHHKDGYSADVEGYFVVDGQPLRLAKTNGCTFVLAEPYNLPLGTTGELIVIVDGEENRRTVWLTEDVSDGQTIVTYEMSAPF